MRRLHTAVLEHDKLISLMYLKELTVSVLI
jgi:hypothetical protein